jgi:predicted dehydrogenase
VDSVSIERIRLGMVGGGEGAFIGAVHRIAARLDDHYELIAGALSSSRSTAVRSGKNLRLTPERIYSNYQEMARAEAQRDDGIEAVAIVTPNHLHAPVATAFLQVGIHVICDKPLAVSLKETLLLQRLARKHRCMLAVTYNYSAYPLVRQARSMVAAGKLGDIRVIQVEYPQGWLTQALEGTGQKQASWRTDPKQAGAGGCIGDIGTHAFQLAEFVGGVPVQQLSADLHTFVKGRKLDDNVNILLRFKNGARGTLWASQVAPGNENALRLRVYGSRGGLSWTQEQPNELRFSPFGEPARIFTRGGDGLDNAATSVTRIPAGHPEGYLEAFATLYREIAVAIRAGKPYSNSLEDGIRGLAFIEAAVKSSRANGRWVNLATGAARGKS